MVVLGLEVSVVILEVALMLIFDGIVAAGGCT